MSFVVCSTYKDSLEKSRIEGPDRASTFENAAWTFNRLLKRVGGIR
jgi:hypothetical protein